MRPLVYCFLIYILHIAITTKKIFFLQVYDIYHWHVILQHLNNVEEKKNNHQRNFFSISNGFYRNFFVPSWICKYIFTSSYLQWKYFPFQHECFTHFLPLDFLTSISAKKSKNCRPIDYFRNSFETFSFPSQKI